MSTTTQSGMHPSDQDSAASAALLAAGRDSSSKSQKSAVLDKDGKLSSASAATSLRYAKSTDLPSFPSQGGVALANAGAAASLANDNQKSFEHWKPGALPAANKAALLAKDYKMDELWQPELSAAGSKAALQAQNNTTSPSIWKPTESQHGMSAAGQAHAARKPVKPITERDVSAADHRKALLAATGAMSGNRKRSGSAPVPPQTNTASAWALKAANSTNKKPASPRMGDFASGDPGFEAARIQNAAKNNVSRQMYTSNPPVSIEVEEKNRQAVLKASAVAMAKKMYAIQQTHLDEARGNKTSDSTAGARVARNRALSDASSSYGSTEGPPGRGYEGLQEAATRLAQEKLAKLHDEHAEYRSYYGQAQPQPRSKLSMRDRRRNRDLGRDSDDSDEEDSRKIRSQMSILSSSIAEVDTKKRQKDRDLVLQAAHKNVTAQLNKMDAKVFNETGKSSPQQRELWERQARERAQRDSDERMVNVGRVHIGGGKYLDQSEIDAIAKARLQPTLDDITEKAEKQRARDEEIRLDQERLKAEQAKEKQRQTEVKAELKETQNREKQEERTRRAEEKRVQNEKSAAEKEKARAEKEEKRKSQGNKPGFFSGGFNRTTEAAVGGAAMAGGAAVGGAAAVAPAHHAATTTTEDTAEPTENEPSRTITPEEHADRAVTETESASHEDTRPSDPVVAKEDTPVSPTKRDSRVKSFFGRFRGKSQTAADLPDEGKPAIAGAATADEPSSASKDEDLPRSDSMRDVALAGRTTTNDSSEGSDMYGDAAERQDSAPVSPVHDTSNEQHSTPTHFATTTAGPSTAHTDTRSRSPSISSLSSSNHETTTATPTVDTTANTDGKPSLDTARTIDSEESRGRPGFRQRLLQKVKPPSKLSNPTSTTSPTSPTVPKPAVGTNASEWGAETEDGLLAAAKSNSRRSENTEEEREREEARDSFKEETSVLKKKNKGAVGKDVGSPTAGSRFVEDL